ncbi:hypothetical protein Nos7524_1626 [Nostoc sp. PCC 7524]|jgi:hypothetical protein|uniref:hypothetical protein n=1 Tax=Nostoc sp. (strain ATCC 29411 / PCC 7524) TaxID=28072 RepID=UPI00029EF61B|nr:hypothetical protein [Nostoc sp. PCC 7524]AFY47499.1 hypothetical protein Nos7524_1626 [Nostoc sp. PCC 7524]
MLVSTFELLVKPQFPKAANLPVQIPPALKGNIEKLSRNVIQGYFLTLSNLNAFEVTLSLVFTVVSNPPVNIKEIVAFLDVDETNMLAELEPDFAPNKIRFTRTIKAGETGLFLLQPNILKEGLLAKANFEVRGYVEVFISSLSTGYNSAKLLLTPEHRGTFYKNLDAEGTKVQLDQIAYSLPTAHGGSLFELSFH